ARHLGGRAALLVGQWPHARVRVTHLFAAHAWIRQRLARFGKQVVHLLARGVHAVQIAVEIRVRRSDEGKLAPRDHEDHAVVAGRLIDRALGETRQQTVDALRAPQQTRAALLDARRRAHRVDPRTGGIDHDARAQPRRVAREQVPGDDTGDDAAGVAPHFLHL